jgi:hypothetical protein
MLLTRVVISSYIYKIDYFMIKTIKFLKLNDDYNKIIPN